MSSDSDSFGSGFGFAIFILFIFAGFFSGGFMAGKWWTTTGYRDCIYTGATMERCVYVYIWKTGTKS